MAEVAAFVVTRDELTWNGVVGADRYDVSRGSLPVPGGADYGACLAEDLVGVSLDETTTPSPGAGFFYLIRADDAICGSGTLGLGDGAERNNTNPLACG